jgi:DNA invertase Pin-like site-specific DNA recombinase
VAKTTRLFDSKPLKGDHMGSNDGRIAEHVAVLIGIGYLRRSQDSGTGVSEEIQDEAIREVAERLDIDVRYWLPADLDASSFTLERPSFQKALSLLAGGKANRLIVAKLNRLTRRRKHWEEVLDLAEAQAWKPVSAEFPDLDLLSDTGRTVAGMFIDQGEREYRERRKDGDSSRRNAVLVHGVHGGSTPPLGYDWTTGRMVNGEWRTHNKKGKVLRGPLTPNADAAKVTAAFEAADSDDPKVYSQANLARILGARSKGAARKIVTNRVYVGIAYSGEYEKPGAHPPLVDEDLFRRVQRKHTERARTGKGRSVSYAGREGALLGGGILRCGSCGRTLTLDRSIGSYRHKGFDCPAKASIQADLIEPVALDIAKEWHRVASPDRILSRQVEDALLPALEDALEEAERVLAQVEEKRSEWDAITYGNARADAVSAVDLARVAVEEAEAGQGWLGMAADRVEERLAGADAETIRSFIGDMVRVMVYPVGKGRRVPVKERIKVQYLVAGRGSDPVESVEAPTAGWGEPVYVPVETAPANQLPEVINPSGVPAVAA